MKTLILICLASVSLLSCNKKRCWECTWRRQSPGLGYGSQGTNMTEKICDKTKDEIAAFEQQTPYRNTYYLIGCEKK